MKTCRHIIICSALIASLASCTGLDTSQKRGRSIGAGESAGAGAVLGQGMDKNTESALTVAGTGAAPGGAAGNPITPYMDEQEQELRSVMASSEAASIRRSQDILVATFKGETLFDYDSAALLPGGYREVERVASVLNRYDQTQIDVGGHTDSSGSEEYNQRLSMQRAETVKRALIQQGVSPSRITAIGYGESLPISSNHAMNRRVEIVIIPDNEG